MSLEWYPTEGGWVTDEGVSARGSAFVDGDLLDAAGLAARLAPVVDDGLEALADELADWNGFFAVAAERDGDAYLAVDHARSRPLYYGAAAPAAASDSGNALAERLGLDTDPDAFDDLAATEVVLSKAVAGDETLLPGMRAVRPGEVVRLGERDGGLAVDAADHHRHHPTTRLSDGPEDEAAAANALEDALVAAAERAVAYADGRTIAVTLSGGYDSRLVLTLLARTGYENLVAVTFGTPDNPDVERAAEVAEDLGVRWEFAEYSTARWREWYDSGRGRAIASRHDFEHVPNYGACPAVEDLLESGRLPEDTVFCPGQTVVLFVGETPERLTPLDGPATEADAFEKLFRTFFRHWAWEDDAYRSVEADRLRQYFPGPVTTGVEGVVACESFLMHHVNAQYYNLDGRQYESYGADWWYPLWDREVVAAWLSTPADLRAERAAYADVADRLYEETAGSPAPGTVAVEAPLGDAVERVSGWLSGTPLASLLSPVYWRLVRANEGYDDHDYGWWGVVPRSLFDRLYTGRESVHSFQALAVAGWASLDDGTVSATFDGDGLVLPDVAGSDGGEGSRDDDDAPARSAAAASGDD
jgi:asparagine synthase (glutamine-hydrolysing)